jgi:hypothetical protein
MRRKILLITMIIYFILSFTSFKLEFYLIYIFFILFLSYEISLFLFENQAYPLNRNFFNFLLNFFLIKILWFCIIIFRIY